VVSYKYAELVKDSKFQHESIFIKLNRELLFPQTDLVWGFFIYKGVIVT